MELFKQIQENLKDIFGTGDPAAYFATQTLFAMFLARTADLSIIANSIKGKAKFLSKYKRIQRMLLSLCACEHKVANFIMRMIPRDKKKILLIMDRTNWKIEKFAADLLFLSISFNGRAIPILFSLLDSNGGACSSRDRIEIVERFLRFFGKEIIEFILCTQEFFNQLDEEIKILFATGTENNSIVEKSSGGNSKAKIFFVSIKKIAQKLSMGKEKFLGAVRLFQVRSHLLENFRS